MAGSGPTVRAGFMLTLPTFCLEFIGKTSDEEHRETKSVEESMKPDGDTEIS